MVLTVTLNPLLERKLYFKEVSSNNSRAYTQEFLAGGKGINISRQLNYLGIKNHALTFLGGASGKKYRSILEFDGISFSVVNTKSETREAALIFDEKNQKLNTYFPPDPDILIEEIDKFCIKLEKAIVNSSIVVFAGSLPNDESSIIIEKGLELCHKYDKISILDSYGRLLPKQIGLGPTVIHNNYTEIESSFKLNLDEDEKFTAILEQLYKAKVKLSFLTAGNSTTFAAKSDFHYKINNPKIIEKDPAGSGDAFVAGIIYGLENSLIFDDFVKLASSLGALNASAWETCRVSLEDAKKIMEDVSIEEFGKKIKLINDSPTI